MAKLLPEIPGWQVVRTDGKPPLLRATFKFGDFAGALAFAVIVGMIAEKLDHHPDLHVSWGKVVIDVWTHDVDGLSEADFVLAARANRALAQQKGQ